MQTCQLMSMSCAMWVSSTCIHVYIYIYILYHTQNVCEDSYTSLVIYNLIILSFHLTWRCFALSASDECRAQCFGPTAKTAQVWWHLPLVALGFAAIAVAARLLSVCLRNRNARMIAKILEEVCESLWDTWIAK